MKCSDNSSPSLRSFHTDSRSEWVFLPCMTGLVCKRHHRQQLTGELVHPSAEFIGNHGPHQSANQQTFADGYEQIYLERKNCADDVNHGTQCAEVYHRNLSMERTTIEVDATLLRDNRYSRSVFRMPLSGDYFILGIRGLAVIVDRPSIQVENLPYILQIVIMTA